MFYVILQFILSAFVIVFAGVFLTKSADKIAEVTGIGKMFVGGLLLAGATSLPELMVDIKAIQADLPNLAVGDLLGSSLFNLLILATLDFAFPSAFRRTAFSNKFLHHSLSAVLTILLTAIIGMAILSQLEASFLGASLFSWAVMILYFYGLRLIYIEGSNASAGPPDTKTAGTPSLLKNRHFQIAVLGYAVATLAILSAAPYLVSSAEEIAKISGLGQTFIGTTLLALTTSLPELVSTFVAFRMGSPDLALGNIFGSNAFNMILFVPLDVMYPKILFNSVRSIHAVTAFGIVAATSVAVMGQLYRKKERSYFFTEPSSETVVAVLVAFLFLLYYLK